MRDVGLPAGWREAKLGEQKVDVIPPDPIGDLGSGWEKIQKEKGLSLPIVT